MKIEAIAPTYLKKDPTKQASELADSNKVMVEKGRVYQTDILENENDEDQAPSSHGHLEIEISHGAGKWFIWPEHWKFEHQIIVEAPPAKLPEWNEVGWNKWESPVSKYFTVGEVTLQNSSRIPKADRNPLNGQTYSEEMVKRNIITVARQLDRVREEWGGPLGINSWLRPWSINLYQVGSRSDNHPLGSSIDFRPLDGRSVGELQRWFEREWYNKGRWDGGFGRGDRRGFVHCDLNPRLGRRVWNY